MGLGDGNLERPLARRRSARPATRPCRSGWATSPECGRRVPAALAAVSGSNQPTQQNRGTRLSRAARPRPHLDLRVCGAIARSAKAGLPEGVTAAPACSAIASSIHFWNSSAVWTVTKPRIRAWPRPQSCAQAIWYWNSGFPVRVRISAVVTVGMNQMGIVKPGTASCFTRNSGTPKLWMTSLLLSLTMIGCVHGQIELIDSRDVVLRGRIGAIESQGVRLEVEQLDVRAAEYPVGAGIVDVPGELLAGDLNDQRFVLRGHGHRPSRPTAGLRIRTGEPLRPRPRRSRDRSTCAT